MSAKKMKKTYILIFMCLISAGLEQRFYQSDPDCIEAGKPLPEFDLYISTVLPLENKGIR